MVARISSRFGALALGISVILLSAAVLAVLTPSGATVSAARVTPAGGDAMLQAPAKPMLATTSEVITYSQNFPNILLFSVLATQTCDDIAVPGEDPGVFTCSYVIENQSENTLTNTPIQFEDRIQLAVDIQGADYAIADVRDVVGDWEYNGTIFSKRQLTETQVVSFTVDFYFPPDAAVEANGPLTSTVLVTSDGTDDNEGLQGSLGVPFTFDPQARVELDKVLLNDEVAAGGYALFELTATNYGPSDIRGASIADTFGDVLAGQPLVEPSQLANFDLAADDTATFVVSARVPDTAVPLVDTVRNDAILTVPGVTVLAGSTTADFVTGTVGYRFLPPTDMSITKTIAPPGTIVPGQEVTFFLDVTNNGPQPAEAVLVSDLLYEIPGYPAATCTGPNDFWTSGGNMVRRLEQMPINTTERVTCVYRIPPDAHQLAAATPVNAFFVAAANPEPDDAVARANNSGEIDVPLQARSTVSLEKTLLNDPVPPDGTAFFELAVCNDGPSDVAGLRLEDVPGAFLDAPTLIVSPDVQAPGNLYVPAGQCRDAVATVRVDDTAPPGSIFSNVANIDISNVPAERGAGSSLDPSVTLAPGTDNATGMVGQFLPPVDLILTKGATFVTAGGNGETLSLQLTNPANSTLAEGVIITELFPFPAVIESVTGPYVVDQGGTLVRTQPMIQGTVDNITIQFSVDPDVFPPGPYLNLAVATADNPESNPANNVAQANINVARDAQLSIDKSDLVDPVRAGEVATYLIRVTNGGPSTIYPNEVAIIDTLLPTGFGIEYAGGSPECNDIIPICSIPPAGGQIEPGETYDLEMAFRLPDNFDPANGPLMNTVTATWTTNPPVMADESTRVVPGSRADLNIIKFVKPDEQVAAGETFTYTIFVDNLGPQTATDIVVEDTMVSSGAYDVLSIADDRGGVCSPTSGSSTGVNNSFLFTCTLGALPIFERWTITVVAEANEVQDVNNTARVYMDDDLRPGIPVPQDPRPENNYAERALNVAGTADLSVSKTAIGRVRDLGCAMPPSASDTPDRVTAGLDLTYTMVVTNTGPSEAVDTLLIDRLPPDIVVTGFSVTDAGGASAGSCTTGAAGSAADPLVCSLGTLPPTSTVTVVVTASVRADVPNGTILENDARVLSQTWDPNDANNRSTNLTTVDAQADLAIDKDDTPDAVVAGEGLTYRLSVVNFGPSFATNVVISDSLHPDLTFVGYSVINGNGVCNVDTRNLATCQLEPIAPNAPPALPVVVEFFLTVNADATAAVIPNIAEVSSEGTDPCPTNNRDDETTDVTQSADLAVFKRARNVSPVAGEQVTFEVTVVNNGPSEADGVVVTDNVPDGLIYLDQNDNCSLSLSVITCEVPVAAPGNDLDAGDYASFDLLFAVRPDVAQGAVITNTATVTSNTPDIAPGNNSDDSVIFVRTVSDLRVRKVGKPDNSVRAGDLLTYTVFVDNLGPSWAHGTSITDEIVSSGLFDVISIDPDVNGNRPTAECRLTSANDLALNVAVPNLGAGSAGAPLASDVDQRATVTCDLPDTPDLNPPISEDDLEIFGGSFGGPNAGRWVLEIVVRASNTASINNIASASSLDLDPDADNNESAVEHSVTDVADLMVEKTAVGEVRDLGCALPPTASLLPDSVTAGLGVTYTITVTNAGPSFAENASLSDRLPPDIVVNGYQVVDQAGAPGGTCTTGTPGSAVDPMVCDLGNLAVGDLRIITITADVGADVPDGTILENDVSVSAGTFDDTNANNRDTNLTFVEATADLEIVKDGDPAAVLAGEGVTYRLSVRNTGPSVAPNVVVSDTLNPNLTFLGSQIIGGSGSCAADTNNLVTCQLGDVAPNPPPALPVVVELFLMVNTDAPAGIIDNTAAVTSDVTDPCAANNSDDATTNVNQSADLAIIKSTNDLTPVSGGEVAFTIDVVNNGPSDAQGVTVDDFVPDGLVYRNQNDFCQLVGTLISCEVPLTAPNNTLDVGQSYSFDLVFDVLPDVAPNSIITNTATVLATTPDAFPANNSDDSTIFIRTEADLRVRKFGKPDAEVRAAELLTYTIIVDNLGQSFSHATVLTDEIVSSGLFTVVAVDPDVNDNRPTAVCTLTSANDPGLNVPIANAGAGSQAAPIAIDINERGTLTCTLPDTPDDPLNAPFSVDDLETFGGPFDGTVPGRWIVEVVLQAVEPSSINDVASVSSDDTDPNQDNNEAYVEHEITDVADLRVTKSAMGQNHIGCGNDMVAMADSVTAGGVISYTVVVTNYGPSDAENVLIFDRLPRGVMVTDYSLVDDMGNVAGDCETGTPGEATDLLTCGVGLLASARAAGVAGESATLIVTATVDADLLPDSVLENDVFVDSDVFDDDNSSNYTSNLTTVNTRADLSIAKINKGPNPVPAGESLTYQLDVVNTGKSVARGVVVTDTLPVGLSFAEALGARCDALPGMEQTVVCRLGDMTVGESRSIFLTIDTAPDTVPSPDMTITLVNTAEISSRTIDPCPTNNVARVDTPVVRVSDVYVEKEALLDPVIAGEQASYLVTFGNNGPSDAVQVSLTDTLPVGFKYNRCQVFNEIDPNDSVDCMVISGNGVVTSQVVRLEALSMTNFARFDNGGGLAAGDEHEFVLIADVDSGYVLDGRGDTAPGQGAREHGLATGYPHYANNLVMISSAEDPAPVVPYPLAEDASLDSTDQAPLERNNFDNEIVRVNTRADLWISKTDIFGDPLLRPDNWFLECDPVQPGGMITYIVTVENNGPSDAAEVLVEDWLDEIAVIHDPLQIDIEIINDDGLVEDVRDTGHIFIIAGRDRNFLNQRELGRINSGSRVQIVIRVMVREDAPCGSEAENRAKVSTRENALMWPPVNALPVGRTPTQDNNPTNNETSERTSIECASLEVNKTISQDGVCPGIENAQLIPGSEVTFCFEIKNTGTTYLDNIMVRDVLQTRSEPWGTEIFTATITNAGDPKLPVAPGATVVLSTTVTKLDCECGDNVNEVTVKADAVNAGRTELPCLNVEPKSDRATIFVACGGADRRLQLPILGPDECEPLLAIQNLGAEIARGMLVVWGQPGACPPQAAGPLKIECTGLIVPGSSWYYPASLLPQGAQSGILYTLNTVNVVDTPRGGQKSFDKLACESLFDLVVGNAAEWEYFDEVYRAGGTYLGPKDINGNQVVLDFEANIGEPLAVVIDRTCPDPSDPARSVSAAYIGVSADFEGAINPVDGGYASHAPLVFASRANLNSIIQIHNSGTYCSSLELWLSDTDNCLRPVLGDVLALAPGETFSFDPNTVVGPDWLGSAFIRASQPLGIVVDTFGPSHFTSYRGVPADIDVADFTVGSFINYAPLTYSEYQGWDSAITVQNLSGVHAAKVKVYFLDRSGGIINTLVDWICPRGNQTFFLPLIDSIPGNWVGSARVESQEWFAWGSSLVDAPRVQSVVTLDKWIDPQRSERIEAVAYNALTEKLAFDWQIGTNKGGLTDGSAVIGIPILAKGNRGITSELAITNLVPKPGFTDFAIYLYDQNGLVDFYCQKLGAKQVEYIDFAQQGAIRDGYLGSAVISATFWEHHVWDSRGNHERNLVGLSAISVERIGGTLLGPDIPGDESKAYEGIPIFTKFTPQRDVLCPGLPGPR